MIKLLIEHFKPVDVEFMTFSGGERNVKIKGLKTDKEGPFADYYYGIDNLSVMKFNSYMVVADITCSDDIMDLLLLKDALSRIKSFRDCKCAILNMPYLPYARQDRLMVKGEALSVVVMANIVNSMGFDEVWIDDPHSDVGPSHIRNVVITEQAELIQSSAPEGMFEEGTIIVAPDAGAIKKATKLAQAVNLPLGVGGKNRNVETGQITGTSYHGPDVSGKRCLIVDDIADGAATFTFLASKLKSLGAAQVDLYVTHGIFSKGIDGLEHLDKIYTTYPWEKYIQYKNEQNRLSSLDSYRWFK